MKTENTKSINNIFQSMTNAIADIEAVGKNQNNQGQNFKYRGVDDIYNMLNPIFAKHKLFTTSTILHIENLPSAKGIHKVMRISYKVYAEDGSFVETEVEGEAIDYGDKVTNKCMAIAHKYALMQLFVIPTEDVEDPDKYSPELSVGCNRDEKIIQTVKSSFPNAIKIENKTPTDINNKNTNKEKSILIEKLKSAMNMDDLKVAWLETDTWIKTASIGKAEAIELEAIKNKSKKLLLEDVPQ